ncbi:MAG: serine hydrolase [Gemmatimonadetes bacterium]|nr:serine hydrolase [Gemmatimonadota bacterium]
MRRLTYMALLPLALSAQDARTPLIGTWEGADRPPVAAAGPITLRRTSGGWRLETTAGSVDAPAAEQLSLTVAAGGTLRLPVREGAPVGRAMWVQPAGNMGYGYATPVELRRQRDGSWRGTVRPLKESVTLAMRAWLREDGTVLARFRNPEFGWNLGRTFTAQLQDSAVVLRDPATGAVRLTQPYRAATGEIEFDFGRPFALRRTSPSPVTTRYGQAPARGGDGWAVATPARAGLDADRMRALLQGLVTADPFGDSTLLVHSLHVARGGRLVVEHFAPGFDNERLHDTRSAFKTFVDVMVGAAILAGASLDADTPLHTLPGVEWPAGDSRRGITLRHLLTHTSGLACDDNDPKSPGNEETMQRQRGQPDWARYLLAQPALHSPGTHYAYCSGGIHLAATLVAQATGGWLPAFFERAVAQPLGMAHYALNLTPTGDGYGGGGAYLMPRDLLKLGQLVLDGGRWRGRQVVPRAWMEASIAHQVPTSDGGSDGLAWHRHTVRAAGREWQEVEANGNGGQMVMVVPELQLVVGVTAGNYNRYGTWRRLREEVLPAIIASVSRGRG